MAERPNLEEIHRKQQEYLREAIRLFPFELIETTGERALGLWEELKREGRGTPLVLGGDDQLGNLTAPFHPQNPRRRNAAEILEAASRLKHPHDLARKRMTENAEAEAFLQRHALENSAAAVDSGEYRNPAQENAILAILEGFKPPDIFDWPREAPPAPELTVAYDIRTGQPLAKVYVTLIPDEDWTAAPAQLLWGGWNACPDPEYHVAAFRSWRDRFGVELIGIGQDTLNLRAADRPATREAALELAREQYLYCNDIVDQGVGSVEALAVSLMYSGWWFFWWD